MTGGGGGPFYGLKVKNTEIDILYLLGVLNSKLFGFIISSQSTQMRGGYYRYSKQYLENATIPALNDSEYEEMIQHVMNILELNKKLVEAREPRTRESLQRQIDATDKQIDKLVYELYGLTEEEIKIVEGG